jgi:hypothetical protein
MMSRRRALGSSLFAIFAVATLVVLPGLPGTLAGEWVGVAEGASSAGQRSGSSGDAVGTSLHDGAKGFGESLLGGLKFVGRTVISPFTGTTGKVSRDADATGERVHKGAKGFGEGLLGGLKYTGRKIGEFFSDSNGSQGR